jgi:2-dehydro-3-deoxy-D-gluconate 5-dehydrogenase
LEVYRLILDLFRVDKKVALVTGASTGIGQATAVALAQAGADVVLIANKRSLIETEEMIKEAGGKSISLKVNLEMPEVAEYIIRYVLETFGRIDILVNNAGVTHRGNALDIGDKDVDRLININIKSVFALCKEAARHMKANGGGKIINISSIYAVRGGANAAIYTATKGAVVSLTQALAVEWGPDKINVNSILPGPTTTALTEPTRNNPETNQMIIEKTPNGRWGEPIDIAAAVVYLSSRASDHVQGASIPIDGGFSMK